MNRKQTKFAMKAVRELRKKLRVPSFVGNGSSRAENVFAKQERRKLVKKAREKRAFDRWREANAEAA